MGAGKHKATLYLAEGSRGDNARLRAYVIGFLSWVSASWRAQGERSPSCSSNTAFFVFGTEERRVGSGRLEAKQTVAEGNDNVTLHAKSWASLVGSLLLGGRKACRFQKIPDRAHAQQIVFFFFAMNSFSIGGMVASECGSGAKKLELPANLLT